MLKSLIGSGRKLFILRQRAFRNAKRPAYIDNEESR